MIVLTQWHMEQLLDFSKAQGGKPVSVRQWDNGYLGRAMYATCDNETFLVLEALDYESRKLN